MAEQVGAATTTFEYELFEGDSDHFRTVIATPTSTGAWIDPASLKVKHRIGHGPFGDVWLATHHQSADDYDEYHEVAVKMLPSLKEDCIQKFLDIFEEIIRKFQRLQNVCWLHGVSILDGKICIVMKFYEGSVGDRVAQIKAGKLQLSDVLKYGTDLAKGILELHSIGLLVLNLKPSNFLLNENNQVVLGEFGIPYLLLGIQLSNSDMALRLGTPNYMAPEQWEPNVRGPVTIETDAWGFGCSILEMLTGAQPWFGRSVGEIYDSVVIKQEKPHIPSGMPPAIENVIKGCFEYDLRNRPVIADILHAFESSQNAAFSNEELFGLGSRDNIERSTLSGYSMWYLLKDHILVGDSVRTRKPVYGSEAQTIDVSEGTVVALESGTGADNFVLVKIAGVRNPLKVKVWTVERVISGLAVGNWVLLKEESNRHSSVGILHSVKRDGSVEVGLMGLETLWKGKASDLQISRSFYVGQFVRVKANVFAPLFKWPRNKGGAWVSGKISHILPNGGLVVKFPGKLYLGDEPKTFLADPAEVDLVTFDTCTGALQKYQHIEDFHWAVRPLAIAFGLFTAMKLGLVVGQRIRQTRLKSQTRYEGNSRDGQTGSTAAWLPSPVANILFKEGNPTTTTR